MPTTAKSRTKITVRIGGMGTRAAMFSMALPWACHCIPGQAAFQVSEKRGPRHRFLILVRLERLQHVVGNLLVLRRIEAQLLQRSVSELEFFGVAETEQVIRNGDGNEHKQHQQELALLNQVSLAGLKNDLGHGKLRFVGRQLVDLHTKVETDSKRAANDQRATK